MRRIKCKDQVIVIAGRDKGKVGTVLKLIYPRGSANFNNGSARVVVEGLNMVKKHVKGNPSQGQEGKIVEQEASMDISNVALLNPNTGKADKVAFKILENENRKVRVFKSSGEVIDV